MIKAEIRWNEEKQATKAVDPREAEQHAVKAFGRNIRICGRPRVMTRSAASAALTMFAGFTGAI